MELLKFWLIADSWENKKTLTCIHLYYYRINSAFFVIKKYQKKQIL